MVPLTRGREGWRERNRAVVDWEQRVSPGEERPGDGPLAGAGVPNAAGVTRALEVQAWGGQEPRASSGIFSSPGDAAMCRPRGPLPRALWRGPAQPLGAGPARPRPLVTVRESARLRMAPGTLGAKVPPVLGWSLAPAHARKWKISSRPREVGTRPAGPTVTWGWPRLSLPVGTHQEAAAVFQALVQGRWGQGCGASPWDLGAREERPRPGPAARSCPFTFTFSEGWPSPALAASPPAAPPGLGTESSGCPCPRSR